MKDSLIAYCGLDCKNCEARIATINNDDELRIKVSEEWSKLNNVLITKEMINCTGCHMDGVKTPFCESLCPIRKCAISKSFNSCGDCCDLNSCDKIKMIISNNKEALERLLKRNDYE